VEVLERICDSGGREVGFFVGDGLRRFLEGIVWPNGSKNILMLRLIPEIMTSSGNVSVLMC
jgi:hypothetical protein